MSWLCYLVLTMWYNNKFHNIFLAVFFAELGGIKLIFCGSSFILTVLAYKVKNVVFLAAVFDIASVVQ